MTALNTQALGERVRSARVEAKTRPGRLRLYSLIICAAAALVFVVGSMVVSSTVSTDHTIGNQTVPSITSAQRLHAYLADADRSAANAFLSGGQEDALSLKRYQDDIASANAELSSAAQHAQFPAEVNPHITNVQDGLSQYVQYVSTAQANNRQGFPVGAAYLRYASDLMHKQILPEVDQLQQVNAAHLDQSYSSQHDTLKLYVILIGVVCLIGIALLIRTQRLIKNGYRRKSSTPLMVATGLLSVFLVWNTVALFAQDHHLTTARTNAYTSVQTLWQARSVARDANLNETLSLIANGNGSAFDKAFADQTKQLVDQPVTDQLIADAEQGKVNFNGLLADELRKGGAFDGEHQAALAALKAYQQYLAVDAQVRKLDAGGEHGKAVELALGNQPGQLGSAYQKFDDALDATITINQSQFDSNMASATGWLTGLNLIIPALAILLGILALIAVQPRISEYKA